MANHPHAGPSGRTGTQTPQQPQQVVPDYSLSADADDAEDGRYSVAEEQNFDQQSDQARRVGQAPEGQGDPAGAMAKSLAQGTEQSRDELRQSIDRAVPRGD